MSDVFVMVCLVVVVLVRICEKSLFSLSERNFERNCERKRNRMFNLV